MRARARPLLSPLTLVLALSSPAWACLWYYGKNVKGETTHLAGMRAVATRYVEALTDRSEHQRMLVVDTSKEPGPQADFRAWSDYAATLVHQGKAIQAVAVLESIENDHSGEYVVAVNLGTAYELAGDNEKALHWIKEGLKRNRDSHWGTEWLHVKILEAKIAAAKDPEWVRTHSVLGLDFGSGEIPAMPPDLPTDGDPEQLMRALEYQLHERLAFVPPPDPLVAGMIGDLADLLALRYSADHAVPVYDLALSYQPAHPELLIRRRTHALKFVGNNVRAPEPLERWGGPLLVLAVVLIAAAVLAYLRKRGDGFRSP